MKRNGLFYFGSLEEINESEKVGVHHLNFRIFFERIDANPGMYSLEILGHIYE